MLVNHGKGDMLWVIHAILHMPKPKASHRSTVHTALQTAGSLPDLSRILYFYSTNAKLQTCIRNTCCNLLADVICDNDASSSYWNL